MYHLQSLTFKSKSIWFDPILQEAECSKDNPSLTKTKEAAVTDKSTYLFLCHFFFHPFLFNYKTLLQLQVLFILSLLLFFFCLPFLLFLDRKDDKWSVCSSPKGGLALSTGASPLSAAWLHCDSRQKASRMHLKFSLDGIIKYSSCSATLKTETIWQGDVSSHRIHLGWLLTGLPRGKKPSYIANCCLNLHEHDSSAAPVTGSSCP